MQDEKYNETLHHLLRERMASGDRAHLRVTTRSMCPVIAPGDVIAIHGCAPEELRRGDILLYENKQAFCTHRLLYKYLKGGELFLVTKGDGTAITDIPFTKKQLLGKVAAIKKGERTTNLEKIPWRIINWLLGTFSLMERRVFVIGRRIKRKILGERRTPFTPVIKRLLKIPLLLFSIAATKFLRFSGAL